MDALRLKLPWDDGFERTAPARDPGMDKYARWINLEVLAVDAKRAAVDSDAYARPFAAGAQIALPLRDFVHALLAPPFRHLIRIGDSFKDARRRSGNENFCCNHVLIWGDCDGCHEVSCSFLFHKVFELFNHADPAATVILARDGQRREAAVRDLHVRPSRFWREFPSHDGAFGFVVVPVGDPAVGEQPRRIVLQHLAVTVELADPVYIPL